MLMSLSYLVQPCKHGYSIKYYALSIIITIEYYSYYHSKEYKDYKIGLSSIIVDIKRVRDRDILIK